MKHREEMSEFRNDTELLLLKYLKKDIPPVILLAEIMKISSILAANVFDEEMVHNYAISTEKMVLFEMSRQELEKLKMLHSEKILKDQTNETLLEGTKVLKAAMLKVVERSEDLQAHLEKSLKTSKERLDNSILDTLTANTTKQ